MRQSTLGRNPQTQHRFELAVGTLEDCQAWGITEVDTQFENKVLTAGFIEAHGHMGTGMFGTIPYVGFFPRQMPDGTVTAGITSTEQLIERLQVIDAELENGAPLVASGFDPIYMAGED
jgi:hypothetical protein